MNKTTTLLSVFLPLENNEILKNKKLSHLNRNIILSQAIVPGVGKNKTAGILPNDNYIFHFRLVSVPKYLIQPIQFNSVQYVMPMIDNFIGKIRQETSYMELSILMCI